MRLLLCQLLCIIEINIISKSQDRKHLTEHEDENQVEEHKNPQIINDCFEHDHDWSKGWEYSQEEEGFHQHLDHDENHHQLAHDSSWA